MFRWAEREYRGFRQKVEIVLEEGKKMQSWMQSRKTAAIPSRSTEGKDDPEAEFHPTQKANADGLRFLKDAGQMKPFWH